ncbi:TIL domain containing protein, partial [Asbolus verrucosus]
SNNAICSDNEIHEKCINYCPPTCQRPNPPVCQFFVCQKGCVCKDGYIRDSISGGCVPIKDCENLCLDNQKFDVCGAACPVSCQIPVPATCNKNCVSGCFCKEGFMFDEFTKKCVEKCPN